MLNNLIVILLLLNKGPGAYLVKPESAKMYSFGKEIRNKKIKQDIPGKIEQ